MSARTRSAEAEAAFRKAVLFHEAGHAVTDWLFGLPIVSVTAVSDGYDAGSCEADVKSKRASAAGHSYEVSVFRALGGPAAHAIWHEQETGRPLRYHPGWSVDYKDAQEAARVYSATEEEAKAFLRWAKLRIRAILGEVPTWWAVRAIAAELAEHGTVSGARAEELIEQYLSQRITGFAYSPHVTPVDVR